MMQTEIISIMLVLPGSLFMLASLIMCTGMSKGVPRVLRTKWTAMTYLISFFMAGYLAFLVIQSMQLAFPLELLTSTVFFGGAIFVFLVMRLTGVTIRKFKESEHRISDVNAAILAKNKELEKEITARRKAENQAHTRMQHLATLHSIDLMITSSLDLKVTMTIFLEQIVPQLEVDAAAVLLLNPHTQTLEYGAGVGFSGTGIQQSSVRLGVHDPASEAAVDRKLIRIEDIHDPQVRFERTSLVSGEPFRGYYALPLVAKGQVKGVLEIFHMEGPPQSREWQEFLQALGVQAAIAIDNANLFNDLQATNTELIIAYDSTIEGWGHALELRDQETEGHTQRVTEMTVRTARAYGLSEKEIVHVRRGALLHDIGKMGIPDSILLKTGSLTAEEEKLMQKHPVYAFELLSPIAYLRPAIDIPYCHHEKWDGTGYPRGLKGEQIPLAARIFALSDIWDALISERRYHKPWPQEKVVAHIRSLAGTQFDPDLVEVFLANVS
jgi:HD-GYP domain-containing protein (c-di-GMP phosphodiesterase class II)